MKTVAGVVVSDENSDAKAFGTYRTGNAIAALMYRGNPNASQTNVDLDLPVQMPFRGSIVGLSVESSVSVDCQITLDGNGIGSRVVGTSAYKTAFRSQYPFREGQKIGVRITTSGAFPNGTQVKASVFVVLDPQGTL
jgi:hypothetical protein